MKTTPAAVYYAFQAAAYAARRATIARNVAIDAEIAAARDAYRAPGAALARGVAADAEDDAARAAARAAAR